MQRLPSSSFFWLIFRVELLLLSVFVVLQHRHLEQVNQIKQVIINDSHGLKLWLCAILLYDKKPHEKTMNSLSQLQVRAAKTC